MGWGWAYKLDLASLESLVPVCERLAPAGIPVNSKVNTGCTAQETCADSTSQLSSQSNPLGNRSPKSQDYG